MTNEQLDAVKESVRAAFAQMTSAEISELVMEPYAEFRREASANLVAA